MDLKSIVGEKISRIINKGNETEVVKRNFIFIMVIVAFLVLGSVGIVISTISVETTLAEEKEVWDERPFGEDIGDVEGYGMIVSGLMILIYKFVEMFLKVLICIMVIYTALLGIPAIIAKSIFQKTPENILAYRVLMAVVYFFLIIPELFLLFCAIVDAQILGILLVVPLTGITIYSMANTYSCKLCE